jgi:hypothetical protein
VAIRFWRRVRVAPFLRLNLSKSGASLSIGHRGAWYTIGPHGRRVTLGLPGTGLFWTEHVPPHKPVHAGHRLAFVIVAAIVAVYVVGKAVWPWP